MPISDSPGREVRRTPAYQAAVWCTRLAYACALAWFFTAIGHPFSLIRFLPWFASALLAVSSLVLLRLARVRFARRLATWYIADPEIRRQFYRDLVWLPPR